MRRVLPVAFLSALLAATPALIAQRGGGGHAGGFSGGHVGGFSGGHMGGFSGGHVGGFSGGHAGGFVSPHYGAGFSGRSPAWPGRFYTPAPRAFSPAPGIQGSWNTSARSFAPGYRSAWHSGFSGYRPAYRGRGGDSHGGHDGDHDGYRHRRGGFYGYGYGYPYAPYLNSWELLPWDIGYPDFGGWDNGYDDSGGYDSADIPSDIAAPIGPYSNSEPYADPGPSDEPGYQSNYYAPYPPNPWGAPQAASDPVAPEPELTLIFKDGHQQAIHNYVLTSSTVIVMDRASTGRQQQIPLTQLNVPATEQAAQQAGLQFHPPA